MSLANFKLYPQQARAFSPEADEILYGGAVGGGKSYMIRVTAIRYSVEVPGLITYLFRRTYKELLSNHIYTPGGFLEMLKPLIDRGDVKWSKSSNSFEFWNGSRIELAHAQYESDVYQYQGAQIGLLLVDEATHFTPFMIRFLRSRLRLGSLSVPKHLKGQLPRIIYGSNPGGVGHHYFKSGFVDFGPNKAFKAPKSDGGMRRMFIPSKMTDNKVLMQTDPDYEERVRGMGDDAVIQAMIEGDWNVLASGTFTDVWKPDYHIMSPFRIPKGWKIDRGYDYGSSAPAAAIWFAEADGNDFVDADGNLSWVPKGFIFVIKELYFADDQKQGLKLTAEEQARRIVRAENDEPWGNRVLAGPADSSIFSNEPGQTTVADTMANQGAYFHRSDKSPGSRIRGVELMRTKLSAARRRPMETPGIAFFDTCRECIRTIPNLEPDSKKPEDIDTQGEDHLWDVIRYRLLKADQTVKFGKLEGV
ncbi:MAG: hypothetical protein LC687_05385 [Actinobacteria bacterium]|nr:hypothetical protein [Actinomycetota bacterium]